MKRRRRGDNEIEVLGKKLQIGDEKSEDKDKKRRMKTGGRTED